MADPDCSVKTVVLIDGMQASLILGALDGMATALTDHNHRFTDGEKAMYEMAVDLLSQ